MEAKAAHLKHSVLERRMTLKPSDDMSRLDISMTLRCTEKTGS